MPQSEEIAALRGSVDNLTAEIAAEKKAREGEAAARKRTRVVTIMATLVVIGVVALAIWSNWEQIDKINDSRAEARIVSCESYNTDTVDRINGILLIAGSDAPERVEPLLVPHRDCTAAGITAYFDGDPATDPYVPVTIPKETP